VQRKRDLRTYVYVWRKEQFQMKLLGNSGEERGFSWLLCWTWASDIYWPTVMHKTLYSQEVNLKACFKHLAFAFEEDKYKYRNRKLLKCSKTQQKILLQSSVFYIITRCSSEKVNRRFGRTHRLNFQGKLRKKQAISASIKPDSCLSYSSIFKREAICYSET
jgi:hypothetical protein